MAANEHITSNLNTSQITTDGGMGTNHELASHQYHLTIEDVCLGTDSDIVPLVCHCRCWDSKSWTENSIESEYFDFLTSLESELLHAPQDSFYTSKAKE